MASISEMQKRVVMAESMLEATLQYESGQSKAHSSPRYNNYFRYHVFVDSTCNFPLLVQTVCLFYYFSSPNCLLLLVMILLCKFFELNISRPLSFSVCMINETFIHNLHKPTSQVSCHRKSKDLLMSVIHTLVQ